MKYNCNKYVRDFKIGLDYKLSWRWPISALDRAGAYYKITFYLLNYSPYIQNYNLPPIYIACPYPRVQAGYRTRHVENQFSELTFKPV